MKISTNFEDKNRIREWAAEGLDADAISKRVMVKPEAVQAYLDWLESAKATAELSPQQRGAITRRVNQEAAQAEEQQNGTDG